MVDLNKLIYWLNRTCCQLDEDICINEGGCCYVAYVIAKLMCKYNIKDYYLSIINQSPKNSQFLEYNIKNHIKKDINDSLVIKDGTCNHYFITINDKRINGCGKFWNSKKLYRINLSVKPKDILWIYRNGDWSDVYDKQYNLRVYNNIENVFKKCQVQK